MSAIAFQILLLERRPACVVSLHTQAVNMLINLMDFQLLLLPFRACLFMVSLVLRCTVLYCIIQYCTVLYSTVSPIIDLLAFQLLIEDSSRGEM